MPPDQVEIPSRKALLTPVTRRRDDSLVFADHLFEVLDGIERHFVFRVAEIHERARVSAGGGKKDFDRSIRIRASDDGLLFAAQLRKAAQQENQTTKGLTGGDGQNVAGSAAEPSRKRV